MVLPGPERILEEVPTWSRLVPWSHWGRRPRGPAWSHGTTGGGVHVVLAGPEGTLGEMLRGVYGAQDLQPTPSGSGHHLPSHHGPSSHPPSAFRVLRATWVNQENQDRKGDR